VGGGAIDHYLLLAQAAAANSAVAHAGTDRQANGYPTDPLTVLNILGCSVFSFLFLN